MNAEHRDALVRFRQALLAYQTTASHRDHDRVRQFQDAARKAAEFAGVSRGVDIQHPNGVYWFRGMEPIPNALHEMTDSRGKSLAAHAIEVVDEALKILHSESGTENIMQHDSIKSEAPNQPDPKTVFIIHGRNIAARIAVEHFLRALGLQPIDFDQLAADQGGTAFIGEIVRAGLEQAQGIVALFTPDEYAALRPDLPGAQDEGTAQRWQARPNVIFEAGMAYGMAPERTVLVALGADVALFSDIYGIHIVRLNNQVPNRSRFRQKLIGIKCAVDERTDAWTDPARAGDFEACSTQLSGVSVRSPFDDLSDLTDEAARASVGSDPSELPLAPPRDSTLSPRARVDPKRIVKNGWAMLIAVGDVIEGATVDRNYIEQAYEATTPPISVYQDVRGGDRSRNVHIGSIRDTEVRAHGDELWVKFDYPNMHNRRALLGPCPDRAGLCIAAVTPVRPVPGDREYRDRISDSANSG